MAQDTNQARRLLGNTKKIAVALTPFLIGALAATAYIYFRQEPQRERNRALRDSPNLQTMCQKATISPNPLAATVAPTPDRPDLVVPGLNPAGILALERSAAQITGSPVICADRSSGQWPLTFETHQTHGVFPAIAGVVRANVDASIYQFPQRMPPDAGLGALTCFDSAINGTAQSTAANLCLNLPYTGAKPGALKAWYDSVLPSLLSKGDVTPHPTASATINGIKIRMDYLGSYVDVAVGPAIALTGPPSAP